MPPVPPRSQSLPPQPATVVCNYYGYYYDGSGQLRYGMLTRMADGTTVAAAPSMPAVQAPSSFEPELYALQQLVQQLQANLAVVSGTAMTADTKATTADTKATTADTKATTADTKATAADEKATAADEKASEAADKGRRRACQINPGARLGDRASPWCSGIGLAHTMGGGVVETPPPPRDAPTKRFPGRVARWTSGPSSTEKMPSGRLLARRPFRVPNLEVLRVVVRPQCPLKQMLVPFFKPMGNVRALRQRKLAVWL